MNIFDLWILKTLSTSSIRIHLLNYCSLSVRSCIKCTYTFNSCLIWICFNMLNIFKFIFLRFIFFYLLFFYFVFFNDLTFRNLNLMLYNNLFGFNWFNSSQKIDLIIFYWELFFFTQIFWFLYTGIISNNIFVWSSVCHLKIIFFLLIIIVLKLYFAYWWFNNTIFSKKLPLLLSLLSVIKNFKLMILLLRLYSFKSFFF